MLKIKSKKQYIRIWYEMLNMCLGNDLYKTNLNIKSKNSYRKLNWAKPFRGVLAIYLWQYLDLGYFDKEKKNN